MDPGIPNVILPDPRCRSILFFVGYLAVLLMACMVCSPNIEGSGPESDSLSNCLLRCIDAKMSCLALADAKMWRVATSWRHCWKPPGHATPLSPVLTASRSVMKWWHFGRLLGVLSLFCLSAHAAMQSKILPQRKASI